MRHRPTTPALRVRAELLERGGPKMWADFMDELRETHLGKAKRRQSKPSVSVVAKLEAAYEAVVAERKKR